MNAAIASGVSAREYGRHFDTVTLCLSKGLGCPLGALLAGSRERMGKARRFKHLFGGAMRQAGVVAAAGIYALDNHVARLAEDHANATRLGARLAAAGLPVDPEQIESNFVFLDVASVGVGTDEALAALRVEGVLLSLAAPKGVLRALTHLDVSTPEIDEAAERIARALRRWTESARPSARGRRAAAR
jgi:threonine aldolase